MALNCVICKRKLWAIDFWMDNAIQTKSIGLGVKFATRTACGICELQILVVILCSYRQYT